MDEKELEALIKNFQEDQRWWRDRENKASKYYAKMAIKLFTTRIRSYQLDLKKVCDQMNSKGIIPEDVVKDGLQKIGIEFNGVALGWQPMEGGEK